MKSFTTVSAVLAIPLFMACSYLDDAGQSALSNDVVPAEESVLEVTPKGVADLLSQLPLGIDQAMEVWNAVSASASNGYDEEYTLASMLSCPGAGVGDAALGTKAAEYSSPLKDLLGSFVEGVSQTRAAGFEDALAGSDLQLYWPYSEDWDGISLPTITFDPENGAESNVGYLREELPGGKWIVKEVVVDEEYAMKNPVWIVNRNEDAGHLTFQMMEKLGVSTQPVETRSGELRSLVLKEFKAHRNYDSIFAGGSEFFVKVGAINNFKASTLDDLKKYYPQVTDFMVNVRRKQVGSAIRLNAILVSDWTDQLMESAFIIIEDDGGKQTTWKAGGTVKIKSKAYGFEVEVPMNRNDDIVWRGKLSSSFIEKYNGVANRFGDVSVTFNIKSI